MHPYRVLVQGGMAMADINVRELPRNDQGVLAAGVLAFIASLFPYYGVSVHSLGVNGSSSTSAWHSYATLALLLVIAAPPVAALQASARASLATTGVSWNM